MNNSTQIRFDEKHIPVTESGCWLWTGAVDKHGYGVFRYKGRSTAAHRVSLLLGGVSLNPDLHVMHSCDCPSCVNPAHLSVGSMQDNMNDMKNKGRQHKGESVTTSKLKESDVIAIRRLAESQKVNFTHLATEYGVSQQTIAKIVKRRTWRHI